jgi:hypothetical protein
VFAENTWEKKAHRYKKWALGGTVPWIFSIVSIAMVDKNRPLIARDCKISTSQVRVDPGFLLSKKALYLLMCSCVMYSSFDQSSLIKTSGAQKSSSTFVVESIICLDVASQWRVQLLAARSDPIQDSRFQCFCIVRSSFRGSARHKGKRQRLDTNQFSYQFDFVI